LNLLFQIFEFQGTTEKVFTSFSPCEEFIILANSFKLLMIELKSQLKVEVKLKPSVGIQFIPFENFAFIKSWNCLEVMRMKQLDSIQRCIQSIDFSSFSTFILDEKNQILYFFRGKSIFLHYTETMELVDFKKNFLFIDQPNGSFLMKNGNLFVFGSNSQSILDKNCQILVQHQSRNDSTFEFVETKNFLASISLKNLIIQDPYTLCELLVIENQGMDEFSSLMYLEKENCILTVNTGASNGRIWFFSEIFNRIQLLKEKFNDIHFQFD
jgi:hypothetical protein